MMIAFLTVGTMGLSNTSLGYLNYPTQVIFKCCKLIPVMIGGVFIQGELHYQLIYMYLYTNTGDITTFLSDVCWSVAANFAFSLILCLPLYVII